MRNGDDDLIVVIPHDPAPTAAVAIRYSSAVIRIIVHPLRRRGTTSRNTLELVTFSGLNPKSQPPRAVETPQPAYTDAARKADDEQKYAPRLGNGSY